MNNIFDWLRPYNVPEETKEAMKLDIEAYVEDRIKEVMPKKQWCGLCKDGMWNECGCLAKGFNKCRQQILDKLKKDE